MALKIVLLVTILSALFFEINSVNVKFPPKNLPGINKTTTATVNRRPIHELARPPLRRAPFKEKVTADQNELKTPKQEQRTRPTLRPLLSENKFQKNSTLRRRSETTAAPKIRDSETGKQKTLGRQSPKRSVESPRRRLVPQILNRLVRLSIFPRDYTETETRVVEITQPAPKNGYLRNSSETNKISEPRNVGETAPQDQAVEIDFTQAMMNLPQFPDEIINAFAEGKPLEPELKSSNQEATGNSVRELNSTQSEDIDEPNRASEKEKVFIVYAQSIQQDPTAQAVKEEEADTLQAYKNMVTAPVRQADTNIHQNISFEKNETKQNASTDDLEVGESNYYNGARPKLTPEERREKLQKLFKPIQSNETQKQLPNSKPKRQNTGIIFPTPNYQPNQYQPQQQDRNPQPSFTDYGFVIEHDRNFQGQQQINVPLNQQQQEVTPGILPTRQQNFLPTHYQNVPIQPQYATPQPSQGFVTSPQYYTETQPPIPHLPLDNELRKNPKVQNHANLPATGLKNSYGEIITQRPPELVYNGQNTPGTVFYPRNPVVPQQPEVPVRNQQNSPRPILGQPTVDIFRQDLKLPYPSIFNRFGNNQEYQNSQQNFNTAMYQQPQNPAAQNWLSLIPFFG